LATSRDLAAAPSRRSRSLMAAVARSMVCTLAKCCNDELSLSLTTGWDIPRLRIVGAGCFDQLNMDLFCWEIEGNVGLVIASPPPSFVNPRASPS
jgi:hypothetical protein